MHILGVSYNYHDAAAALIKNGILVAAAEEERFTRKKHDSGFPYYAIQFCLKEAGIKGEDLDFVVFYEKPFVKLERILTTTLSTFPRSWRLFCKALDSGFDEKLWVRSQLMTMLNVPAERVLFVDHHVSHAASAFFCSPFKEAAILTVDGVGEWTTAACGVARACWNGQGENTLNLTKEMRFPHSLGLLYSVFTAFLGFEVNEGEYKVMGMAPYGQPRYQDQIYKLVNVAEDGSFHLNMEYFRYHYSTRHIVSDKFIALFGEPRNPQSEFVTKLTHDNVSGHKSEIEHNQYYADVAASIQRVTEDILLKMANHLYRETKSKALCLAGGVALNSVANGRILQETPFEDLYIQPSPGDAGGAVGAALYVWHVILGKPRSFIMESASLGQSYDEAQTRDFLDSLGVRYEAYEDVEALLDRLVDDLTAGKVIGWFQGRFEWGPRALGNRSILADPRRADMKRIVNSKIKFREPFRPFAPVILEDRAAEFFEGLPDPRRCYPLRYMQLVLPWKPDYGEEVPAVNHLGTGRLQTIRKDWNSLYYGLVEKFGKTTGVPVLMNTSFNLRGEPIVGSLNDAWNTFSASGIDVLVMERFVVRKN